MSAELHLVNRCEHDCLAPHLIDGTGRAVIRGGWTDYVKDECDGGSVVVLDPERVLWASRLRLTELTTQDILDALAQERT